MLHIRLRIMVLVLLGALLFNLRAGNCQTVLAEMPAEKNAMDDVLAIPFHDSIFFSYHEDKGMRRSKWIREGGESRESGVTAEVMSIARFDGKVYYYYLAERKGAVALKAQVESAGTLKADTTSIALAGGIVLGAYQEKNFFMVLYNRDNNQIIWHEINGLQTVKQRTYELPFDLSFYLRQASDAEFFNGFSAINTFKGASKIKLFRYDNLYLVFDQPYRSIHHPGQTSVVVLSPDTNKAAHYEFPTRATAGFTSFLVDGKLLRSFISKDKFVVRVYDLFTGKTLMEEAVTRGKESFNVYLRYGKKNIIDKTETLDHMMKVSGECEASLTVVQDSGRYLVMWGTFFNDPAAVPPVYFAPVGLFVALAYNAILMSGEKPGINRYFYYGYDPNDLSFTPLMNDAAHTRGRLDDYEIEVQAQKLKIGFKDYIAYKNGIVGIYYEAKKKTARLVYFK